MADQSIVLDAQGLDNLIVSLSKQGYAVKGPRLRDRAVVYDDIDSLADLPRGYVDEQDGGSYRLRYEGDAYFGYVVGPQSWKAFLHPPRQTLWRTVSEEGTSRIVPEPVEDEPYAFFGVRPCELAAIEIQDKVFTQGPYVDQHYQARREAAFIVVVNCARAGETCFCTSMGTGPKAKAGFDLALTEIATGEAPAFLVEAGSARGKAALDKVKGRKATADDVGLAEAISEKTAKSMTRSIDTHDLSQLLKANPDHPRWAEVAERCLSCANCTMVCPTCFCTSVEDQSAIDGSGTAREQRWDSCFTSDFTYIHGGAVRPASKSRYRQWMTHKLGTWVDQFDSFGCVGCGRCITWCPVGIDITEEAAAIRATVPAGE